MIQLSCLQQLANRGPVPIPVHIHAEHFPEINLTLSTAERMSTNAIYNLIFGVNECVGKMKELIPRCGRDADTFQQLRVLLDNAYRNSHHALLLIRLHLENIKNLERLMTSDETNQLLFDLESRNDSDLVRLAAKAKKDGAAAIRQRYQDGAVSLSEVSPTPAPIPGHFYFDPTGAKYKCLGVQDGIVNWMQLESQIGAMTFDLHLQGPLDSFRHCYEITDPDEKARLERRCTQAVSRLRSRGRG
jgi:hypothetical protein